MDSEDFTDLLQPFIEDLKRSSVNVGLDALMAEIESEEERK